MIDIDKRHTNPNPINVTGQTGNINIDCAFDSGDIICSGNTTINTISNGYEGMTITRLVDCGGNTLSFSATFKLIGSGTVDTTNGVINVIVFNIDPATLTIRN